MKRFTRYTRYTGKKEDVYPLVLAFVGAILGWAAVKTRDLEGTLALVKWGLVLGFIAVATDPNGNPEDEPTVTAIRSLEATGTAAGATFDAWTEGNVIRASKSDVRVYGATGLQFMIGQPLAKGLYIVTDGISSKKLNIR